MTDLTKALLWRHNDAVKLQSLIANKQAFYDKQVKSFFSDWKKDVFDLETANDFGLMVWSIILDFPISINSTESAPDNSSFGFGAFRKNFGHQFSPPSGLRQIFNDFDLLPRPNSVEAIYIDAPNSRFGFGANRKNFGGTFR